MTNTANGPDIRGKEGYVALALDMYADGKNTQHPEDARKFVMEALSNAAVAKARFLAAYDLLKQHDTCRSIQDRRDWVLLRRSGRPANGPTRSRPRWGGKLSWHPVATEPAGSARGIQGQGLGAPWRGRRAGSIARTKALSAPCTTRHNNLVRRNWALNMSALC